jgi:hypothetical protein
MGAMSRGVRHGTLLIHSVAGINRAEQLSFKPPDAKAVAAIPVLAEPPWPKAPQ